MHFNIEADYGHVINGWAALDNPSASPSLIVSIPGANEIRVEPSVFRLDVKESGLHSTGLCGFAIDETIIPNLSSFKRLTIFEDETQTPLYARWQDGEKVGRRVLYIDYSIMPQNLYYKNINSRFALHYNFTEQYAFDTMLSIIGNLLNNSVLLTGRPAYQRFLPYIRAREFFTTTLLRNPFEELAERILFLNLLSKSKSANLIPNFTQGVEALIGFSQSLDVENDKSIVLAFKKIDAETRLAIQNPMTRILGCGLGEKPERRHVSIALECLSQMDLVGTRDLFVSYRLLLAGLLGTDISGGITMETSTSVIELASRFSKMNVVRDLLEHDLALFSYAEEAIEKGLNQNGS